MQATLPAAANAFDAIAPRAPMVPPLSRSSERSAFGPTHEQARRRDDFASKLAEARDRKASEPSDASSTKTASVEPTKEAKAPADAAPAEQKKPNDAAKAKAADEKQDKPEEQGEPKAAATGVKKPKPADDAASDDVSAEVPVDGVVEAKKPAKPADTDTANAAALAAAAAAAQPTTAAPVTKDTKPSKQDGQANDVDATVAAAAVATQATQATDAAKDATDGSDDDASAQAAPVDPAATLKPVDADGKADKPQPAVAKAAAKEQTTDVVAAKADAPSTTHDHGSRGSDHQQPKQDDTQTAASVATAPDAAPTDKRKASAESTFDDMLSKLTVPQDAAAPKPTLDRPASTPAPTVPAEQKFAADNVDNVVRNVRTQIDAGGGQMRMRLDPPELGALEVAMKMVDGRMTASFTTSNDQATQLLSHSLSDLKHSLEASGITVDRIQVRQSSTSDNNAQQQPGDGRKDGQSGAFDQSSSRGDQQRKEAVEKMWRKLAYGSDELDFVA